MRIFWHFLFSILLEIAAFIGGFLLARLFLLLLDENDNIYFSLLLMVGFAFSATFGVRALIRRFPAVCPKCGGRTYQYGIKPIQYFCKDCGHNHSTGIRSNT